MLDEKIYKLVSELYEKAGFSADRYDRITDFTRTVAIIPISALHGVGVPDALLLLVGLSQRFLEDELKISVSPDHGRGTVLEVKEEKGLGKTIDVIVYDGTVHSGDYVLIGTLNGIKDTKIRALLKPKPLDEIRDPRNRFDNVKEVSAAAGIKILAQDLSDVMAGMPVFTSDNMERLEELRDEMKAELTLDIETDENGLYVKADTIGSLEAIYKELKDKEIGIKGFGIGDISRRDIVETETITDQRLRVILAFNVHMLPEAREYAERSDITIIEDKVIYNLIDRYEKWLEEKNRQMEKERRRDVVHPGMVKILPEYIFRMSNPAIVGVRVLAGRIRPGQHLIREDGRRVGSIKSIQKEKDSVKEAHAGDEVAIAITGAVVGRSINPEDILYVDIPEGDTKKLFNELYSELNSDEIEVLEKVAKIKRKDDAFWGM